MYLIIGQDGCKWCDAAKAVLEAHGFEYKYFNATKDLIMKDFLDALGKKTVPQIWHEGYYIGDFEAMNRRLTGVVTRAS